MQELIYFGDSIILVIFLDMFSQVGLCFGDFYFYLDIFLFRIMVCDFGVLEVMYGECEFQLDVVIVNYVFFDYWECFWE